MTHVLMLNSRTDGLIHRREVQIADYIRTLDRVGADRITVIEKRRLIEDSIDSLELEIEILQNAKRYNALYALIKDPGRSMNRMKGGNYNRGYDAGRLDLIDELGILAQRIKEESYVPR